MKNLPEPTKPQNRITGIEMAKLFYRPILVLKFSLFFIALYSILAMNTNAQGPFLFFKLTEQNANLGNIKNTFVEYEPGKTTINWLVEKESAVVTYIIEKSMDMLTFTRIGKVVCGPTSQGVINCFSDKNPAAGLSFYRLLVTHRDGTYGYTNPVKAYNGLTSDKEDLAALEKK